jgi:hypothetical protein
VGDGEAEFEAERVHDGEGHVVVADEDGVGAVGAAEHVAREGGGGFAVVHAVGLGHGCEAVVGQRLAEAAGAVAPGGGALPARDVGDAAVAAGHEEVRDGAAAGHVVGGDLGEARVVLPAVEHDDGDARGLAEVGQLVRHGDRGRDDAVHAVVEQFLHDGGHAFGRVLGHEDEDVVALLLQRAGEAFEGDGVELVVEVGHDEADDAAFPGDHRAGERVGAVAELRRRLQHLGLGRGEAEAPGVKTRETADCETPARRATSVEVILVISRPSIRRRPEAPCR